MNSCGCGAYCARSPWGMARAISLIMAERIPENLQQKLSERLRYYEDMGIRLFYRDRSAGARAQSPGVPVPSLEIQKGETILAKPVRKPEPRKLISAPARKTDVLQVLTGPSRFASAGKIADDSLPTVHTDLGDCTRCKLHKGRNKIVFGDGNPKAALEFV